VEWIGLAQNRYRWRALVNTVMNLRVPSNAGKVPSGCTTCGLSCGTQLHRGSYLSHLVYRGIVNVELPLKPPRVTDLWSFLFPVSCSANDPE
jgi:hypothetical protein